MKNGTSTLQYVVQNFHTCGDPQLEEIRQAALKELEELRSAAAAHYQIKPQPIVLETAAS